MREKSPKFKTNAQHALETVNTSFAPPQNATPEHIQAYKDTIRSMAHATVGMTEFKNAEYGTAENDLRPAAAAFDWIKKLLESKRGVCVWLGISSLSF